MNLFEVGQKIDGKILVKQVLMGGMGVVYVGYDESENSPVAIKSFQPRFFENQSIREQFIQEANLWVELGWHQNIVCALYVEKFNDIPHIVMEYVPGKNLRQKYLAFQKPSPDEILNVAIQICDGMIYSINTMAEKGIALIHRDLKPENILMTADGLVKVTDFGIARAIPLLIRLQADRTKLAIPGLDVRETTGIAGTYPYMSPEQFIGTDLDSRSDVYSFGCVFYELLTGRLPFLAIDHAGWQEVHSNKRPVAPSHTGAKIPAFWDDLIMRCLEKNRSLRWNSFEELRRAIETSAQDSHKTIHLAEPIKRNSLSMAIGLGTSLNALGYHEQAVSTFHYVCTLRIK